MAAFSAAHARTFLPAVPLPDFVSTCRTGPIYKTSGTVTVIGNGAQKLLKSDYGFWVVNTDNWRVTAIAAMKLNGKNILMVVEADNYKFITATGPGGTSYTSFAKAESPSRQSPSAITEAAFSIGANSPVVIDSGAPKSLPKALKSYGFSQIKTGPTSYAISQNSGRAVLDVAASKASNAKETYDQAVDGIVANLKAKGYAEATPRIRATKTGKQ